MPLDGDPSTLLEQERNEEAWRQLLVQGVLAVLLPTEDLENGCLRALVAEIFAEMILGNGLSKKACEPWLLWDAITTVIEAIQPHKFNKTAVGSAHTPNTAASRLEQFGLLAASKEGVDGSRQIKLKHQGSAAFSSASGVFWTCIQYMFLAFTAVRGVIFALATSSTLPSRSKTWLLPSESDRQGAIPLTSRSETSSTSLSEDHRPILCMTIWSMMGHLIELKTRMPWLFGLLTLFQHGALFGPLRVGDTDGALDR